MSSNNSEEGLEQSEQSFISHLIELRNRLMYTIVWVLFVLIILLVATDPNHVYSLVAEPLLKHMPQNSTMIAIDVASPFFTPIKLTLVVAVFLSIPFILYQFWAFVAPGLYKHERRMIFPLLIASTLLFYIGMAFAYFVVFPLVFGFLTAAAPVGVSVMTDITKYLDFVLTMFFAFGVCFEVPIFTIVMVWTGLVTPATLSEQRPYVILGAFIIGMFLTPPDAISQTMLAIPMWLLFEVGLLFSRLYTPRSEVEIDIQQNAIEKKED
jgi:sec-independent protein translocase protein TatC